MSVIHFLDQLDRAYLRSAPITLCVLGATSAYYVAFSYGAGVTFLLLGRERAIQIFGNSANHPVLILVGIPLIPVVLVSLEAYDLEGRYGHNILTFSVEVQEHAWYSSSVIQIFG